MKVGVIGAGSWGTALSNILADNNCDVTICGRDENVVKSINSLNENFKYLKGFILNDKLKADTDIEKVISKSDIIVNSIPTQHIRSVYSPFSLLFKDKILINSSKGIEKTSLFLIDQIFADIFHNKDFKLAFLSGPSFALEVVKRLPTATTVASTDKQIAHLAQKLFNNKYFRVYTETDVKGVLLGGAIKNVIAIGAGIVDSMCLGNNTRASLITRGLAEIARLGKKLGAHSQTFAGLTGLGDLVLTCTGDLSRNRKVGMELGRGKLLQDILCHLKMAAEGVDTSYSVYKLSELHDVEMPISNEIYNIIYKGKSVSEAIRDLMSRELKEEKC